MKKTVNHILAAGLLALLSLASCTDEFIEGNDLQGVDRDKRVEVRLPFGVGRGITTTITTRAAGGEIDYDVLAAKTPGYVGADLSALTYPEECMTKLLYKYERSCHYCCESHFP